jgi:hypothetical protein
MNSKSLMSRQELSWIFGGMILVYFLGLYTNLIYNPIAWIDEVMDLDPAVQWVNGNGYQSKLWPYKGSDSFFLANLPLRNLSFILSTYLFGPDIFWVRLPHFIMALMVGITLFYILQYRCRHEYISLFLVLFIMLDKGLYESIRSVRCEMLQVFLFLIAFGFTVYRKKPFIAIIAGALLYLVHPASWGLSLLIFVWNGWMLKRTSIGLGLAGIVVFLIPGTFWLWMIDFNFSGLHTQLFAAGMDHSSIGKHVGTLLRGHFLGRYEHYFPLQIWSIAAVWAAHILAVLLFIRRYTYGKKPPFISYALLIHSIYWLVFLEPHVRYSPTMMVICYVQLIYFIPMVRNKWVFGMRTMIVLIALQSITFAGINSLGFSERFSRNPYNAMTWIHEQIQQNRLSEQHRILLAGQSIGAYFHYQYPGVLADYMEPNYPHHFDFSDYDELYVLWNVPVEGEFIAKYYPAGGLGLPVFKGSSLNYKGFKLFRVTPDEMRSFCLKVRNENPW